MTAIYASVSEVRQSSKFVDANFITDDIIEMYIENAQGQIDLFMKTSLKNNFTPATNPFHYAVKQLCIYLVLLECIGAAPDPFYSAEDRNAAIEIYLTFIKINFKLLSDAKRVELLKQ